MNSIQVSAEIDWTGKCMIDLELNTEYGGLRTPLTVVQFWGASLSL